MLLEIAELAPWTLIAMMETPAQLISVMEMGLVPTLRRPVMMG
jgi:hypothetical protein